MITGAVEAGKRSGVKRAQNSDARASLILNLHIAGLTKAEIARRLSVSTRTVFRALSELEDDRIKAEELIEDCGLDSTDIHLTLSRMHDADLSDIIVNPEASIDQLKFKPLSQWPPIWRQGLAGKIKLTPVTIPDGQRTAGGDQIEYKVEIERESLLKILELSAKLKQVNALVSQNSETNILLVTADTARKVIGARKRLEKVIDVTPEKQES